MERQTKSIEELYRDHPAEEDLHRQYREALDELENRYPDLQAGTGDVDLDIESYDRYEEALDWLKKEDFPQALTYENHIVSFRYKGRMFHRQPLAGS